MKAVMYHYVRPANPELPYFRYLHIDDFRRQLDHFQQRYHLINQGEFLNTITTCRPAADAVVLTFDDGLADQFQYVVPELLDRGLWGIFYVPTGPHQTGKLLDVHRTHLLLGKWGGGRILELLRGSVDDNMLPHQHVKEFRELTYCFQDDDAATLVVKRILNYYIAPEWQPRMLDRLWELAPVEGMSVHSTYLAPESLAKLQSCGMMIGSHSVRHPVFSKLAVYEQEEEIRSSFAFLEAALGGLPTRTFCYPYGGFHTFTSNTERLLAEAGVRFAFNVEPRDITSEDLANRPRALPRYDCNQFPFGKACRGARHAA